MTLEAQNLSHLIDGTHTPTNANLDTAQMKWLYKVFHPITIKGIHVKGHQDDNMDISLLTCEAILNVEMDQLAKTHWKFCQNTNVPPPIATMMEHKG